MLHNLVHNILRHLGGVEQYGIFSLCLFCSIFAAVVVCACFQKKSYLDRMAQVPLDESCPPLAPERGCLSRSGDESSATLEPAQPPGAQACCGRDH